MKLLKRVLSARVLSLTVLSITLLSFQFANGLINGNGGGPFPLGPNVLVTPGAACAHPTSYRYPERIKYCDRNVESSLKNDIIQTYDRQFGFSIGRMQRSQFKIDHYIPLCAGGSNDRENLWPQHESVYKVTDPLEPLICEKMAAGRLKQARAIEFVKAAKNNLSQVPAVIRAVQQL